MLSLFYRLEFWICAAQLEWRSGSITRALEDVLRDEVETDAIFNFIEELICSPSVTPSLWPAAERRDLSSQTASSVWEVLVANSDRLARSNALKLMSLVINHNPRLFRAFVDSFTSNEQKYQFLKAAYMVQSEHESLSIFADEISHQTFIELLCEQSPLGTTNLN